MLIDLIQKLTKEYQEKVKNELKNVKTEDDEDVIMEAVNISVKTEEKPRPPLSQSTTLHPASTASSIIISSPKTDVASPVLSNIITSNKAMSFPKIKSSNKTISSPKAKSPIKTISSPKAKSPIKTISSPKIKPLIKTISSPKTKSSTKAISSPKTVTSPKLGFRSNMMRVKSKGTSSSSNNKTKKVNNHNPISIPEKKSSTSKDSATAIKRKLVLQDSYIHTPSKNRKKNNTVESSTSTTLPSDGQERIFLSPALSYSVEETENNLNKIEEMIKTSLMSRSKSQIEKEKNSKENNDNKNDLYHID